MECPKGIIASIVTPFKNDGSIDEPSLRELVRFVIDAGVHGIGVAANTGEFVNMSGDELKKVLDICMEEARGRVATVMGIISTNTELCVDIARYAEKAGADAILVSTPYYIRPSVEGVVNHFRYIADKATIPMIVFNHPLRTGIDVDCKVIEMLTEIDTFVGIKECDPVLAKTSYKLQQFGDRITVLSGDDALAVFHFLLGAQGGFLALANLAPRELVQMYNAVKSGDISGALEIHRKLLPLNDAVYIPNYPETLKVGLDILGKRGGVTRLPLYRLRDSEVNSLRKAMTAAGLI